MPRFARIIAHGIPHHIILRGNRRLETFFCDADYQAYQNGYIEMNPVRARLAPDPYAWKWSSVRAHADGTDDILVKVSPLLQMVGDWKLFLRNKNEEEANKIRGHERTGRALGSDSFLESLEHSLKRAVKRRKPGRRKKAD